MNQNNEMFTINDDGEIVLVSNSYNQSTNEQNLVNQQQNFNQQHAFVSQQGFSNQQNFIQQGSAQKNSQNQRQQVLNQRMSNGPKVVSVSPMVQPNRQSSLHPHHPQQSYQSQKSQQNSLQVNRTQIPQTGGQRQNTQNLAVKNNNVNLTRQESVSYDSWKKKNLHMNQMVQPNGQINVQPQYRQNQLNQNSNNMNNVNHDMYNLPNEDLNDNLNFDLEENTQNEIQELYVPSLSNRAKHGSFMSNETNKYNNYTTFRAKNVTSALAIRKSKNSESSFL